jgi:photoactive yellow protein
MVNTHEMDAACFDAKDVIGRNFFTDIAPCANVRAFLDPFERAVAGNHLNVRFDFLFNLPKGLRRVTIHMLCNEDSEGIWMLISPLVA